MVGRMSRGQDGPTDWWISSVQSTALDQLSHAIQQTRPHDRVCVLRHRDVPMMLNIEFPERLGMDRLFAAWGAWIAQGRSGAVIVVQVGTALTMDFVDSRGVFQGGTILPGVLWLCNSWLLARICCLGSQLRLILSTLRYQERIPNKRCLEVFRQV